MTKIHQQIFGHGKPIVLVHGWAMHSGIWRDFAQQLARNHQVTCIDLPGHGHSESIDAFTLEQVSSALVNAVKDESSCWLGWSLGASVVLDIAGRFPERVNSLVLLAGNPHFKKIPADAQTSAWPGVDIQLLEAFAQNLREDCQATLLRFLSLQVNGLPDVKPLLKALKSAVLECKPPDSKSLQGGLDILKQADLRAVLADLKVPVSIIAGTRDTLVPVAAGHHIQALLPSSQLNIIDKAGHVPFLSHAPEIVATISRFMAENVR